MGPVRQGQRRKGLRKSYFIVCVCVIRFHPWCVYVCASLALFISRSLAPPRISIRLFSPLLSQYITRIFPPAFRESDTTGRYAVL